MPGAAESARSRDSRPQCVLVVQVRLLETSRASAQRGLTDPGAGVQP